MKTLKDIWWNLRSRLKYHTTKDFRNIIKTVREGYPWDEGYLYDLERAKLVEMRNYHQKRQWFDGWERVVRDMSICINLIDIFTEKYLLFHYDRDVMDCLLKGDGSTVPFPKYICDVKVNVKNADRFLDPDTPDNVRQYYIEQPHELYILKAKHLYHKIRLERDGEWWD